MSCEHAQARKGYKYVLTLTGLSNGLVRVRFDEKKNPGNVYKVPKSWLDNGFVKEIKED